MLAVARRATRPYRVPLGTAALLVFALTCRDVTVTPVAVRNVSVTPTDTTLTVGDELELTAEVTDEAGNRLTGRAVTWSSDDAAIVSVNATGAIVAVSSGETSVTATVDGRSGAATILVLDTEQQVDSVVVEPAEPSVTVGGTVQLRAIALAENGDTVAGRPASWESADPSVATVDDEGLVTGVAEGEATITATIEDVPGTAAVTVSTVPVATIAIVPAEASVLVGDTVRLEAIALAENGDTLAGRMASWSSDETGVATVDAEGLVTGIGEGDVRITATIEDASASVTVTVSLVPVASVEIVPADTSIFVGQTVQLAAIARSPDGDPLEGRDVDWDSRDDDVATVDENTGLVTAVAAGTARIEAEIEDEEAVAEVTVSPTPVVSVVIAPADTSIFVGDTVRLVATALDADGEPLDGREVEWTSDNPAAATVDDQGLVTGTGAGTAKIMATIEGVSATAEVTVSLVPVASVAIAPADTSIFVGETVQLVATALDANGEPLDGREVESWTSDNPAAATVDGQGLVTGLGAGTAPITATIEGVAGAAEVTVSLVPVASVVIEPAESSIFVGETVQLVATALDADGQPLDGREVESWTSNNPAAATVDGGLVTGVGAGTATITATIEGVVGAAEVTVEPPVGSITISPPDTTLVLGQTSVQYQATLLADDGITLLPGRTITWAWTTDPAQECSGIPGSGSMTISLDPSSGVSDANGMVFTTATVTRSGILGETAIITAEAEGVIGCAVLRTIL